MGMEKCAQRHGVYWNRLMTHEEKDLFARRMLSIDSARATLTALVKTLATVLTT